MKILRVFLLVSLAILFAQVSFADGTTDPKIIFGGGGSCQSFDETLTTQPFTGRDGVDTGCPVDFTNKIAGSTFDIQSLTVTVTSPFDGSVSCSFNTTDLPQDYFNTATPSATNACTFTQVTEETPESVPGGDKYSLEFDSFTSGGAPLTKLDVGLTATPEPATLLLLGTGLCSVATLRKRLKGYKTTTY